MGKINREDVVQAALTVERWCKERRNKHLGIGEYCDCPFNDLGACKFFPCYPDTWDFERYLRNRGKRYEVDKEFMKMFDEVAEDKA